MKQKIFNSYPINSIPRKHLVQEEKARDLQAFTTHIVPQDIVNMAIELGEKSCLSFLKRVVVGVLGLCFVIGLGFFAKTVIESVLLIGLGLFLLHWVLKFIRLFIVQAVSVKLLKDEYKKTQEQLKKMKKDLLE